MPSWILGALKRGVPSTRTNFLGLTSVGVPSFFFWSCEALLAVNVSLEEERRRGRSGPCNSAHGRKMKHRVAKITGA